MKMKLNKMKRNTGLSGVFLSLGILATGFSSSTASATAGAPDTPPAVPYDLGAQYPQPQPVLHATFTDPNGGTGRVLYTITNPTGSRVVTDAQGEEVSSGSDSVYQVPLGSF